MIPLIEVIRAGDGWSTVVRFGKQTVALKPGRKNEAEDSAFYLTEHPRIAWAILASYTYE